MPRRSARKNAGLDFGTWCWIAFVIAVQAAEVWIVYSLFSSSVVIKPVCASSCLQNLVTTTRLPDVPCSPLNDTQCPGILPAQGGGVAEQYQVNVTFGRGAFRRCGSDVILNGTGHQFSFSRALQPSNIVSFTQRLGNSSDSAWRPRCNDSLFCQLDRRLYNSSHIHVNTSAWHWFWPLHEVRQVPWTHWSWLQEVPGNTSDFDAMDFWQGRFNMNGALASDFFNGGCVNSLFGLPGTGDSPQAYTDQLELHCNPRQQTPIPTSWTSLSHWPPTGINITDPVYWQLLLESTGTDSICGLNQTQLDLVDVSALNPGTGLPGQWLRWINQHAGNRCGVNGLACGKCSSLNPRSFSVQSAGPLCRTYNLVQKQAIGAVQINVTLDDLVDEVHTFWMFVRPDATGGATVSFRGEGAGPSNRVTISASIIQGLDSTWNAPFLEADDGAFVVCGDQFPESRHNPWKLDPSGTLKPVSTVTYFNQFNNNPDYKLGGPWFWMPSFQQRPVPLCGSSGPSVAHILQSATPAQIDDLCDDIDSHVNDLRACLAHASIPCSRVHSLNQWSQGSIQTTERTVAPLPPSIWKLTGEGALQPPAWLTKVNQVKALVQEVKDHMPAVTMLLNIKAAQNAYTTFKERLYALRNTPGLTVCNFINTIDAKEAELPSDATQQQKDEVRGQGQLTLAFNQPDHLGNPGPIFDGIERHYRVQVECDAPLQISDHTRDVIDNHVWKVDGKLSGGQTVHYPKPMHVQFQQYEQYLESLKDLVDNGYIIKDIASCRISLQSTLDRVGPVAERLWVDIDHGRASVACRWVNAHGQQKIQDAQKLISDLSDGINAIDLCKLTKEFALVGRVLPDYCQNGKWVVGIVSVVVGGLLLILFVVIVSCIIITTHKRHS